jgi:hypothetical protein
MKRKAYVFKTASNLVVAPPRLVYEDDGGEQPHEVAVWVKPQDRVFFLLLKSLYKTPRRTVGGYAFVTELSNIRIGVWRNASKKYFIACKGTSVSGPTARQDILDDAAIGGLLGLGADDVTLVGEAARVLHILVKIGVSTANIAIGGHSLGGYAAMVIATKYKLKCCAFNAAASPANPVLVGPGPELATHYHIAGDFISSHMLSSAADVIRVDKNHNYFFNAVWAHSSDRFFEKDPTLGFMNASQEDVLFMSLGALTPVIMNIPGVKLPGLLGKIASMAGGEPIPGSVRSLQPPKEDMDFEQVIKSGKTVFRMAADSQGFIDLIDLKASKFNEFFKNLNNISLLTKKEAISFAAAEAKITGETARAYTSYSQAASKEPAGLIDDLCKKVVDQDIKPSTIVALEKAGISSAQYTDEIYKATKASYGFVGDTNVGAQQALKQLKTPLVSKLAATDQFKPMVGQEIRKIVQNTSLLLVAKIDQAISLDPSGELNIRHRAEEIVLQFSQMNKDVKRVLNTLNAVGFDVTDALAAYDDIQRATAVANAEISSSIRGAGEKLVQKIMDTKVVQSAQKTAATVAKEGAVKISESAVGKAGAAVVNAGKKAAQQVGLKVAEAAVKVSESALVRAGAKVAAKVAALGGRLLVQAAVTGAAFLANPIVGAIVGIGNFLLDLYFLIDLGISLAEFGAYTAEIHQSHRILN